MKLNWKWIGIGIGGVLGVLVLAIVLFIAFFPKELAAREAERRIEEATGRNLVLGDNIDISFWPALGFSVDQISLSNPASFDDNARRGGVDAAETPFIAADRIVFAVAVMPLLSGKIEVKQLIFEGADVQLRAKDDGTANWTFPTEEADPEQPTLEDLRLDDVQLIDSIITFQGAEGEEPLILSDVDASLALESLDTPAQLTAAFDYRDQRMGSPMAPGGGFGAFRVTAQMAHEGQTTALNDLALRLDQINANGNLTLITQEKRSLAGQRRAERLRGRPQHLPPPARARRAKRRRRSRPSLE